MEYGVVVSMLLKKAKLAKNYALKIAQKEKKMRKIRKWKLRKIAKSYLQVLDDLEKVKEYAFEAKGESETDEQFSEMVNVISEINRVQSMILNMSYDLHGIEFTYQVEESE